VTFVGELKGRMMSKEKPSLNWKNSDLKFVDLDSRQTEIAAFSS